MAFFERNIWIIGSILLVLYGIAVYIIIGESY